MSSKNSPKIVFANKLLHAGYSLEINEQRLINLALSKINSKKPNPGKIVIYPTEYAQYFGLNKRSVYEQLSAAAESLRDKSVTILDDKDEAVSIPWVSSAAYEKVKNQGSFITLEFSKEVEPYIFNIVSPGGLPHGLTIHDALKGRSEIRNTVIARVFKELDLVEQCGSGIQRIKEYCSKANIGLPVFSESGDFTDWEFPRNI
jgi:plasmid replication initiation protein